MLEYIPTKLLEKGYKTEDFVFWGKIKRVLFFNIFPIEFTVGIFYLFIIIDIFRRFYKSFKEKDNKNMTFALFLFCLVMIAGIQFAMTFVSNGTVDIGKQIYLYNIITDILICFYLIIISNFGIKFIKGLKGSK